MLKTLKERLVFFIDSKQRMKKSVFKKFTVVDRLILNIFVSVHFKFQVPRIQMALIEFFNMTDLK